MLIYQNRYARISVDGDKAQLGVAWMKNQYFGNIKDLFKYDLAEFILRRIPSLERITFITMLTENDGRSDGGKLDYQGKALSKRGHIQFV